jgi:hypothetical protein
VSVAVRGYWEVVKRRNKIIEKSVVAVLGEAEAAKTAMRVIPNIIHLIIRVTRKIGHHLFLSIQPPTPAHHHSRMGRGMPATDRWRLDGAGCSIRTTTNRTM